MTDQELQKWVEAISLASFGRPFRHRASFNRRLRATGGRYFTGSHNIEISWLQWEKHGADEVEKIIKHELCHYHLHLTNRGYRHRDADFKYWLARVGGSRYCKPVADSNRTVMPYRYKLTCQSCGMHYLRKRKVDVSRYVCGKCRGKLKLESVDTP
ncbi:SprT family protein [Xylanibacillus composti]|uniref:Protein SprT n=1 Tax=Xylanibacillus composti TaxID=1572762 RepID=A0A8J4H5K5_9BACL|nr:SprT family protein [Xylanibacillus composti]MDT9723712.1 SprT family protein [Xylanibacillus composti]GIQ71372.1 protein SprT [Xylanibacillus composti]